MYGMRYTRTHCICMCPGTKDNRLEEIQDTSYHRYEGSLTWEYFWFPPEIRIEDDQHYC